MAKFETWIYRVSVGLFGVALLNQFAHAMFWGDWTYLPPDWLPPAALIGFTSLCFLVTILLAGRRVLRLSKSGWFEILAFFPISLLISMFMYLAIEDTLGFVLRHTGAAAAIKISVLSSSHGGGRSCKIRNEYTLERGNASSYWCSKEPMAKGSYEVLAFSGGGGTLIVNASGIGSGRIR